MPVTSPIDFMQGSGRCNRFGKLDDTCDITIYRLRNRRSRGKPNFIIETPNKGEVKIIAGTNPIKVLIKAVKISDVIISLSFKGAINKLVKFLLHISSKKSILKLMLDLKRIS